MTDYPQRTEDTTHPTSDTYYDSPLETLVASLEDPDRDTISAHDIAEAYNTLCCRIRVEIESITGPEPPYSISAFNRYAYDLYDCLFRHLRSALRSPFAESQIDPFDLDLDYEPDEDDIKIIKDNALICQHTLLFVSDIFAFPALYSNFTEDQLSSILTDVLCICTPASIPVFNHNKLYAMVIWILKTQHLPCQVLTLEHSIITATLRNAICQRDRGPSIQMDAFKAVHCILKDHPTMASKFIPLLLPILEHLQSSSIELRFNATLALCGFAMSKLRLSKEEECPSEAISQTIVDFVTKSSEDYNKERRLRAILESAFDDGPSWKGAGASFGLVVLSCLIVLLDQQLFWASPCLQTVIKVLAYCKEKNKRPHSQVWQYLVWAFAQIPLKVEAFGKSKTLAFAQKRRNGAYLTVAQDLRPNNALYMVACLTRSADTGLDIADGDISRAIGVVEQLASSRTLPQALYLFSRLLEGIGVPSPPPSSPGDLHRRATPIQLVDGSLLGSSVAQFSATSSTSVSQDVLALSETQIRDHWDALIKIWVNFVQKYITGPEHTFSKEVISSWQTLLLVHGQLIPGHEHLTSTPAFASKVVCLISNLYTSPFSTRHQARYLVVVNKLWSTMKNVFSTLWLSFPAEMLFASMLKKPFDLASERVKEEWNLLCADLISVGIPTILHVLRLRSESQEGLDMTKQLWLILAKRGPFSPEDEDFAGLLQFLVMPIGVWDLNITEIDLWAKCFKRTIDLASATGARATVVLIQFLDLLNDAKMTSLKRSSAMIECLMEQLALMDDPNPDPRILNLADEVLFHSYRNPVPDLRSITSICISLAQHLAKIPSNSIVDGLKLVQRGLSIWLKDDDDVLSAEELDKLEAEVYSKLLDALAQSPMDMDIISDLAPFIHTVFSRDSGIGPEAFAKFWRATFHQTKFSKKDYPELIKICLSAVGDMHPGCIGESISVRSDSSSTRRPVDAVTLPGFDEFSTLVFERMAKISSPLVALNRLDSDPVLDSRRSQGTITPLRSRTTKPSNLQPFPSGLGEKRKLFDRASSPPKRRRTDPDVLPPEPVLSAKAKGKRRARDDDDEFEIFISASHSRKRTRSAGVEPLSIERSVPSLLSPFSLSKAKGQSYVPPDTPSIAGVEEVDYDDWERELDGNVLEMVSRRDDVNVVPDSEEILPELEDTDGDGLYGFGGGDILSPSIRERPTPRSRRRERSQTAPEVSATSFPPLEYVPPLRRHRTSPSPQRQPLHRKSSSSAQLDALRAAYAIVTDTGTSQIEVQDIMVARRLANQINQVLDEQMCSKIARAGNGAEEDRRG